MSINFSQTVRVHGEALHMRAERTRVLSANIANENTPGYQAQDMDFAAVMQNLHLETEGGPADAMLADGGVDGIGGAGGGTSLYRVPYHPSRDGNTVEIGVEQAAFSQNASDFQTSLTFVSLQLKGLAKAIAGQ
ncbi:MAG: flagellar basal body rod protein FlgB [Pseudomonadota bacterium]